MPKSGLWSAGIVAGGKQHPADCAAGADQVRYRRGGEQAVAPDQQPGNAVSRRQPEQGLQRHVVVVTPVTADHQGCAAPLRQGVEQGLEIVFQVVRLAYGGDFFTQPGGTGALIEVGFGG